MTTARHYLVFLVCLLLVSPALADGEYLLVSCFP